VNESSINARREEQNYEWIVPVDYMSNLDDFSDAFILNRSQSEAFGMFLSYHPTYVYSARI
jgi:hypothetical protein